MEPKGRLLRTAVLLHGRVRVLLRAVLLRAIALCLSGRSPLVPPRCGRGAAVGAGAFCDASEAGQREEDGQ